MALEDRLRSDVAELERDVVELRHRLQRRPEIGLKLPETQRAVLDALAGLPLEISTGSSCSSVTAVLRGTGTPPGIAASYYLDQHNAQATQNPLGPTVGPAVYTTDGAASTAASYIDTADAATLDNADGAIR